MITQYLSKRPGRLLGIGLIVLILLAGGLALDLAKHGIVWNIFWSLTGEETPLSQVRGMVEWAGNFIRLQPQTAPDVPISHTDVPPYGINTFLQQEVEVAKRDRSLQMIADAGFKMIRQQFPWDDIEISGRGDFTDQRNDLNGDGVIDDKDTVSAWAKYDNIVDLAEKYGIQIQARLDNPPKWTRANPDAGDKAPPDDYQDFVNYAVAVAKRYEGRIYYYQIWNEPNANDEWGTQPVNPEAYTDLLCRTYKALKAVDAKLVVISGPLSPTVSLTDRNLNDFIFLQRMYDAGAKDCFDVMSAQGYGFFSGPTDHRLRPMTLTYARHIYIRDIMVANGDANKAIWISEAAWNPQPNDPTISLSGAYGIVTEDQAARYMPIAYQRAQEEWPWIGNISYWFFKRPADYEKNQAFYYFRMVEPDFTPLPVYNSMKQYITTQKPVLYAGVHQAESWAIKKNGNVRADDIGDGDFGNGTIMTSADFTIYGTNVIIKWKGGGAYANVDNQDMRLYNYVPAADSYKNLPGKIYLLKPVFETSLRLSSIARLHAVKNLNLGEGEITLLSITVLDRTVQNILPIAASLIGVFIITLYVIISALRERRK